MEFSLNVFHLKIIYYCIHVDENCLKSYREISFYFTVTRSTESRGRINKFQQTHAEKTRKNETSTKCFSEPVTFHHSERDRNCDEPILWALE